MPKMKTNRLAYKKFRVTARLKVKRGQANTSHNTAKQSPKRSRHLRGLKYVDKTNLKAVLGVLPYCR